MNERGTRNLETNESRVSSTTHVPSIAKAPYHFLLPSMHLGRDAWRKGTSVELGDANPLVAWTNGTSRSIPSWKDALAQQGAREPRTISTKRTHRSRCWMYAMPHHARRGKSRAACEERDQGRLHVETRSKGTPSGTHASLRREERTVLDDEDRWQASNDTVHAHEAPSRFALPHPVGTHDERMFANFSTTPTTTSKPKLGDGRTWSRNVVRNLPLPRAQAPSHGRLPCSRRPSMPGSSTARFRR